MHKDKTYIINNEEFTRKQILALQDVIFNRLQYPLIVFEMAIAGKQMNKEAYKLAVKNILDVVKVLRPNNSDFI